MEKNKPIVFVIMPFSDDFFALFEEFKTRFADDFEFKHAGNLDDQQSVLKDIVEGICNAAVVIADLTGLSANVFYELGLAHAMNKKVIIITQDISIVPFDIKPYRVNEYSLKFNKIPSFLEELKKLLRGAIDNTIQYGSPVTDYAFQFTQKGIREYVEDENLDIKESHKNISAEGDKGIFDLLSDIKSNYDKMNEEFSAMTSEVQNINDSTVEATNDINRVNAQRGNIDIAFVRTVCKKISDPIDNAARKMKIHVKNIASYWEQIENDHLKLLDSKFIQKQEELQGLKESRESLIVMRNTIGESNTAAENFISVLKRNVGIEKKLSEASLFLISELESFLSMTDTMASSIDRIIAKSDIVIKNITEQISH